MLFLSPEEDAQPEVEREEPWEEEEPTDEIIQKLMDDHQLYRDPYCTGIITDCYGRTALHMAIAAKHEHVVSCFIKFQGKLCPALLCVIPKSRDFNLVQLDNMTDFFIARNIVLPRNFCVKMNLL